MVFSLRELSHECGSVADFLFSLVDALRDPAAVAALEGGEPGRLERKWRWLAKYVTIRPSFIGFNVDGNQIIENLMRVFDRLWGSRKRP